MSNCPNCGEIIPEGVVNCPRCGNYLPVQSQMMGMPQQGVQPVQEPMMGMSQQGVQPVQNSTMGMPQQGVQPVQNSTMGMLQQVVQPVQAPTMGMPQQGVQPVQNPTMGMSQQGVQPVQNSTMGMPQQGVQPVQNSTMGMSQQVVQQNMDYASQQQVNSTSNDEELLKAFIGKNYEKITTSHFNFAAFFFASAYMFYRKMFLYGILLYVLFFIVINCIGSSSVAISIIILTRLIVGFFVNKIYLGYAKKKITKIKFKNVEGDNNKIKSVCTTKGGTSVGKVFLGFLVEVIISIIILVLLIILGFASALMDLFSGFGNLENGGNSSGANNTYNGVIVYDTSVKMSNEFSISVPDIFEDTSDSNSYSYEYESDQGVFDSCKVNFSVLKGYSSADDLINQMASYYVTDDPTVVTTTKINNVNWYLFSYDDSFGTTYYYGTTKNNKVFLLEYEIQEDAASDCDSYRQQILDSINKK